MFHLSGSYGIKDTHMKVRPGRYYDVEVGGRVDSIMVGGFGPIKLRILHQGQGKALPVSLA